MKWCLWKHENQPKAGVASSTPRRRGRKGGQGSEREVNGPAEPPHGCATACAVAGARRRAKGWLGAPLPLLAWLFCTTTASGHATTRAHLPTLTQVKQIRTLSFDEAVLAYPIRIRGVVTYYYAPESQLFVQDGTAGIWIDPDAAQIPLHCGQFVQVEGTTGAEGFTPEIEHPRFQNLGEAPMPRPLRPSSDELASAEEDSQWIEMEGTVRSVDTRDGALMLNLTVGAFECGVVVRKYLPVPSDIIESRVRVRGVFSGLYDRSFARFIGFQVLTPSWSEVQVLQKPAAGLWSAPARPVRTFLRLTPEGAFTHRVNVRGVVTFQDLGHFLCLRDHDGALLVDTAQLTPLQVGDVIEATGYPALGDYTVVMRDAIFRKVSEGVAPEPVTVDLRRQPGGIHDADLVRLKARLLNFTTRAGDQVLELQGRGMTFRAKLRPGIGSLPMERLRAGSLLQLTGVMRVEADKNHQPNGFEILLRSPADLGSAKPTSLVDGGAGAGRSRRPGGNGAPGPWLDRRPEAAGPPTDRNPAFEI